MVDVRLICWNADLARERIAALSREGLTATPAPATGGELTRSLRRTPPAAVLIDLDRLPSHGREVAVWMRATKSTRSIPIVFAGGLPEKVEKIRKELPDAAYTDWKNAAAAVRKALKHVPARPVIPVTHMQRYAASDLAKKLGVKAGLRLTLMGAPDGFRDKLGDPAAGAASRVGRMTLWFVRSRAELESEMEFVAARLAQGDSLWAIHPKRAGSLAADFNQTDVRAAARRAGLVDYKVCSVDADWSGLKFVRKK